MSQGDSPGADGKAIGSWEGCVVMDCGEKVYQDFLVDQAQLHVEKFPESSRHRHRSDGLDLVLQPAARRRRHVVRRPARLGRSLFHGMR